MPLLLLALILGVLASQGTPSATTQTTVTTQTIAPGCQAVVTQTATLVTITQTCTPVPPPPPPPPPPPALSITSPVILPAALVSVPYTANLATLVNPQGGVPPYTYTSSNMPPGLVLASNGAISGTPTAKGAFTVNFVVTDSSGASLLLHGVLLNAKVVPSTTPVVGVWY